MSKQAEPRTIVVREGAKLIITNVERHIPKGSCNNDRFGTIIWSRRVIELAPA